MIAENETLLESPMYPVLNSYSKGEGIIYKPIMKITTDVSNFFIPLQGSTIRKELLPSSTFNKIEAGKF